LCTEPALSARVKAKKKILIVEDNSDLRRLYAIGLNQRGFEVKLAANGAEAVDRIEHDVPDILILDLLMPIMSGWEVIQRLERRDTTAKIPVIIISGQAETGERPRPEKVVAWLSKPVSLDELAAKITEVSA
jgi:CheY-like chemotaxis protein